MKKSTIVLCAAFLAIAAAPATAQQKIMNDMKDMPMGTMENNRMDKPAADQTIHSTRGKVTKVDGSSGMVTLAHEPVGTLNWPSMTMGFMVMDKALLEKLSVGKTVDFDFVQSGKGYAITSVR